MKLTIKGRIFCLVFVSWSIYWALFHSYFKNHKNNVVLNETTRVNIKYVVVHLDLKGSPPKLKYLESLLPMLKKFGVNGLMMEYEDTFPYEGELAHLSSKMRYNKTELKDFLIKAAKMEIEIIPLIQTFGHMEFVLKLKKYKHLREKSNSPDSICPSKLESRELIREMLEQVIYFHSTITPLKYIHIGCDEVYVINKCKTCRMRQLTDKFLFIDHVRAVRGIIYTLYPPLTVLMWDDMFQKMKIQQWSQRTMNSLERLEPVCWDYSSNLKQTSHVNLYRYHQRFKRIWIASAFKGADGVQALLPDYKTRFQNHYSWMNFINDYVFANEKVVYNFNGIILTGWSRYSHFQPLCELLPASLPILLMNLLLIQRFRNGIDVSDTQLLPDIFFDKYLAKDMNYELKCEAQIKFNTIEIGIEGCMHESSALIALLRRYYFLMLKIDDSFHNSSSIYSLVEKHSKIENLGTLHANLGLVWCTSILKKIEVWRGNITTALIDYYEKNVIEEYIGYKTNIVANKINNTLQKLNKYLKSNSWLRRSYNFN